MRFYSTITSIAFTCFLWPTSEAPAQTTPAVTNQISLPFLLITPDATAAGIGDAGVSTKPDVYAMYWNAAKYTFTEQSSGIAISITPWKRQLAEDMNLFYLTGYHQIDQMQAIGASIKYFTSGNNIFTDDQGNQGSAYKPMDLSLDFAYIRKLSEIFSLSTTVKYVRSDMVALDYIQGTGITGQSFAADIGVFYHKPIYVNQKSGTISFGATVANLGPNIKYGSVKQPMPILARIGSAYHIQLDQSISYAVTAELNKILAKSTADMPNVSLGLETSLLNKITLRTGYYRSEGMPEKGQYLTAGLGLNHRNFGFNFSYLFPTQEISALNNTIRYSLSYAFGSKGNR